MNVQVITDPHGRLLWASAALPGAVHDIKAARTRGIIDALTDAGSSCWADKGCQGGGGTVRVPFRGRLDRLTTGQRAVNIAHARIRALGEQAMAPSRPGACYGNSAAGATRITNLVQTVLTLHLTCSNRGGCGSF